MLDQEDFITVPKVGILNFGSRFRWLAVLESVQRNSLTNTVTLQSIPLFCRFLRSEFHCVHWNPLSNTLNIRILQWIPLNAQSSLQWNAPLINSEIHV